MPKSLAEALHAREIKHLRDLDLGYDAAPHVVLKAVADIESPKVARAYLPHGNVESVLAAPLFYDQPLVDICPSCHLASDSALVRKMTDEGLLVPVLHADYGFYSQEFLTAIGTARHVGPNSLWSLTGNVAHHVGDTCICARCTQKKIAPTGRLPRTLRSSIDTVYLTRLSQLPGSVRAVRMHALNEGIRKRDVGAVQNEGRSIELAAQLANAQALAGVPQFHFEEKDTRSTASPDILSKSLSIEYTQDMDLEDYVSLMKDYQGKLGFLLNGSAGSWEDAISIVARLNEEVSEIRQSARAAVLEVVTNVYRQDCRRAVEALVGGAVGLATLGGAGAVACAAGAPLIDGFVSAAAGKLRSKATRTRAADVATSKYFGKSLPAVQVWRVRRSVEKLRVRQ